MGTTVQRPAAGDKRINFRDDFELCYLRHQYIRRSTYNPSEEEMRPFKKIVECQSKNTFFTYKGLFNLVGLESEDVANIGLMQLTSFLGSFSMDRAPEEKYNEIWERIREYNGGVIPDSNDILNKDKADFTSFFKQRMEDLVRVCKQKARNIKGAPTDEIQVFYGPKRPWHNLKKVAENHQEYGFKKMDLSIFKSIKKKMPKKPVSEFFRFGSNWYFTVPIEQKAISLFDLSGADMDPYDSLHNMTPEQALHEKEELQRWEDNKVRFFNQDAATKIGVLEQFIQTHKNQDKFCDELKAAKKILKKIVRSAGVRESVG